MKKVFQIGDKNKIDKLVSIDKETKIDAEIILIGITDGGIDISNDMDDLIKARDAGKTIVFTHGHPSSNFNIQQEADESIEEYNVRQELLQEDYRKKLLENFGVEETGSEYKFYTKVKILDDSYPIFMGMGSEIEVEETHSTNVKLSDDCTIIANDPLGYIDGRNYYLAIFEEAGKGLVIHWNVGHGKYGKDEIGKLPQVEKTILKRIFE